MDSTLILITGTLVMTLSVFTLLIFIINYQKKIALKNKTINQIQVSLSKSEIDAKQKYIEGQGIEKKRIAKELHDGIGSDLTILRLKNENGIGVDFNSEINDIMKKIRVISHDLNKGMFAYENIELLLRSYIEEVSNSSNLNIEFESFGLSDITTDEVGHNVFRIIQELIQNTVKHANATEVFIEITHHESDSLSIIYTDNGSGLKKDQKSLLKKGIGLLNIQDRVKELNGSMEIMTKPKGFEMLINCRFSKND